MTNFKKKILAGILSGAMLFTGGLSLSNAQAADTKAAATEQQQEFNPRRERPTLTEEQINEYAKEVADYYGVSQAEVAAALKDHVYFGDIKQAATFAKISGKSFAEVLAMKCDWWQVAEKLGITPEKFDAFMESEMIASLAKDSKLDEKTVASFLKDNYDPRDICMAGLIANASGKSAKSVMAKRKINNTWDDVAKEFKVDLRQLMEKDRESKKPHR